ncbi:flagellar basal body-associated FliL family protein [Sphingomonas sp. KC8]|uniref:flagellar basal body-associated FliL family protein n=1 Tax=Sphingomonas sp. KC8 TaxID=1030157 RepID=UPI0002488ADC|nr:flagellar basal body-associated FliL family protein [Sphingomonas sp. KC8]ARS27718.1 flagellar basal body-associated protein FliL [Sphingomonas sp. KC8]
MSDDNKQTPKKKGKLKTILLIAVGGIALIGGGVGAGLYAAGAGLAGGHKAEPEDPTKPKLVPKEGASASGHAADKKERPIEDAIDPGKYKATYYDLAQNFTSNLRDSDGFMQVSVGVSTYYDQRVLDRVKEHEMAIRSAVLMTLADQDSFVISTPAGKKELQKSLKKAINDVLIQKEGFGGVDDVYFTNFIIQ